MDITSHGVVCIDYAYYYLVLCIPHTSLVVLDSRVCIRARTTLLLVVCIIILCIF